VRQNICISVLEIFGGLSSRAPHWRLTFPDPSRMSSSLLGSFVRVDHKTVLAGAKED